MSTLQDKTGAVVETQYKVTPGKTSIYTLNLYHKTSSCLVNGKNVQLFSDTDFPGIIHIDEYNLT